MYTNHFGFKEKPFKLKSGTRYFYSTPALESTAIALTRAIADHQPVILLTGLPGSGKTSLLRRTLETLGSNVQIISLGNPTVPFNGMIEQLVERLELGTIDQPLGEQIEALRSGLGAAAKAGTTVVVTIDDAHAADPAVLQDLSSLGRSEDGSPLFILLVCSVFI